MAPVTKSAPIICVVGFHHARGPEIEQWFGVGEGVDPAADNDWSFLPFMALADGAHASTEDFSYFTLRRKATPTEPATSLFGISCTRQINANELIDRPADVTRSTVQKALVVVADTPRFFGQVKEKLSMVTGAWFHQKDFTDVEILKAFQDSLANSVPDVEEEQCLGLSFRELLHEYRYQTLVLFKCCLLQPKMLFFGSRCEKLCMIQFALISLIPGLLKRLEDAADPDFDSYWHSVSMSTSLKTSDRSSLLAYMGLPLQLFGKGSLLCPYIPLQQLDILADHGTTSYIVGSTNSLLLQQKDRYSDILINLDDASVNITSPSLRNALSLTVADRRWIDFLTQTVTDTWDEAHPSRPNTMGYMGSEDFIRLQFEEYLLALLSATKYHLFLQHPNTMPMRGIEGDPTTDFGSEWLEYWKKTPNYYLFTKTTDSHLFDVVEPRHPTAGALTIEDVQRRVNQHIQTLHLDEKFATSRETLNKHLAVGHQKFSTAFASLQANIEAKREAYRQRQTEAKTSPAASREISPVTSHTSPPPSTRSDSKTDFSGAQASISAAGQKAGAYFSSWGAWAAERKKGWGQKSPAVNDENSAPEKESKRSSSPSPSKLSRWSSMKSSVSSGGKSGKEEKGEDGIGRLDA